MKFAHFSPVWNKPGMTPAQRYEQLWRELVLADESPFDFGFCVEHHFNPNESWMPAPSITQTVIEQIKAAATEGLFNSVIGEFNGDIEEADLMRSIRLFGNEVIPALRGFSPY